MTLTDATPITSATTHRFPTPRQHRLEASVAHAIATRRPRSQVREAVHRLIDQLRWQGVSPSETVAHAVTIASRASLASSGDSSASESDHTDLALVERWATLRSSRAD